MSGRRWIVVSLLGLVWGLVVTVLGAFAAPLVLGVQTALTAFPGAIAGWGAAIVWLAAPAHWPRGVNLLAGTIAFGLLLCLLTAFAPLGMALGAYPLWAPVLLVVLGVATTGAVAAAIGDAAQAALNRYRLEQILIRALKGLGFVFFTVIVVLPFYAMVMTGFKKQAELLANPLDYSIDFGQGLAGLFSSYIELFTTFDFGRFVLISTVVSVVTVALTLAASIPGAYAIARLRFPGRQVFSRSILLIYMVPAIVLVIPLYAVFSQLGLRDTLLGLMIVYPATTIPVALYILQGYFRSLPPELEEAGMMDGCSRLGVIRRITLPLSVPAIASVALYVFMIAWNEFLFAFMFLDDPAIFTLSRAVVSLNNSEVPRQHLMAGAVTVTIPVLVLFLCFERFLVSGLTAGSVKG